MLRIFKASIFLLLLPSLAPAATIDSSASAIFEIDGLDTFGGGTGIGTFFLNTQGDGDAFSEFGVIDFDTTGAIAPTLGAGDFLQLSLSLSQSVAGFSTAGDVDFFLATENAEIVLGDTRAFLASGDPAAPNIGADTVGDQFGTLFTLGTGAFVPGATGDIDTFAFNLDSATETFVLDTFAASGVLRVLVTPGDEAVAATFSGAGSGVNPIPSLAITAVPEPSSLLVLGLATGIVATRRRAKRRR